MPDDHPPVVVTGWRVRTTWQGVPVDTLLEGDSNDRELSEYLNALQQFSSSEEDAPPTPCVDAKPTEADLNTINRHAKAAVSAMKANDGAKREMLAIIYSMPIWGESGPIGHYVGKIMIQTSNQQSFVYSDLSLIPDNATVIGAVHTHVPDPNTDGRLPSQEDQNYFANMEVWLSRNNPGAEVSFNPIMYIYDAETDKTYVYDRYKISSEVVPCTI